MKDEAQEALGKLESTTAQALMQNGLQDWAALGERFGFATPLPARPAMPAPPAAPDLGKPPREDEAKYNVELSTLDKLLSSRRIKKQDAALRRFEKDRKAWNEDRDYALGLHEQQKRKHRQEVEDREAGFETALTEWKAALEAYLRAYVDKAA